MKKIISILMALALLLTGISLAETATQTEAPVAVETQSGGLFGWLSDGWDTISTSIRSGWNTVTGAISSGWNTVTGTISSGWNTVTGAVESGTSTVAKSITESEWYRTVEDFITKNSAAVSDVVVQSWETIRQGAADIGSVAWEKIEEAYHTILDWFDQHEPEKEAEVREALDQILQQLRADYQKQES